MYRLNQNSVEICQAIVRNASQLRAEVLHRGETQVVDLGITTSGSLEAGRLLAEGCMAGLGKVEISYSCDGQWPWPLVITRTDHPVAACMASQYAGWQVSIDDYFAMGSGPMRAAAGREELFDKIGHRETTEVAVGVLETRKLPPKNVCASLAIDCGVAANKLTLLVAPTASLAGTVQIVARSVETSMHKLLELDFDLQRVVSGLGVAPLPPPAADDLEGIGRTNDAVLYGGRVTLWVRGDDDRLQSLVEQIPSCASPDFGRPFIEIFEEYERDFYKIDPHLFSPAEITLVNLETGRTFRGGTLKLDVLHRSFEG